MVFLTSHESGDLFLEYSQVPFGTTRQAADSSWLNDEHSVVELHADQCGTI
jgi:hypothetical protein